MTQNKRGGSGALDAGGNFHEVAPSVVSGTEKQSEALDYTKNAAYSQPLPRRALRLRKRAKSILPTERKEPK
jgi:hypothetical protein